MRDYRGKRLDNGEWVYGYLVLPNPEVCRVFEANDAAIGYQTSLENGYLFHEVLKKTVGQYTGIYTTEETEDGDTQCVFIYEGDIVDAVLIGGINDGFSWGRHVVVFDNGAFCLKDRRGQCTPMCNYSVSVKFRVLGNVWDNPELMEVNA